LFWVYSIVKDHRISVPNIRDPISFVKTFFEKSFPNALSQKVSKKGPNRARKSHPLYMIPIPNLN